MKRLKNELGIKSVLKNYYILNSDGLQTQDEYWEL
jgi:hypothetical protein